MLHHERAPFPARAQRRQLGDGARRAPQPLPLAPGLAQRPARLRAAAPLPAGAGAAAGRQARDGATEVGGHRSGSAPIRLVSEILGRGIFYVGHCGPKVRAL